MILVAGTLREDSDGHIHPRIAGSAVKIENQGVTLFREVKRRARSRIFGIGNGQIVVVGAGRLDRTLITGEDLGVECRRLIHGVLIGVAHTQAVVVSDKSDSGARSHIERHFQRGGGGQKNIEARRRTRSQIGRCCRNINILILQGVHSGPELHVSGRSFRLDLDVVVGQKHGVETDQTLGRREIERIDTLLLIIGINYRFDFALSTRIREGILGLRDRALRLIRGTGGYKSS